jgi:hypothetical protein
MAGYGLEMMGNKVCYIVALVDLKAVMPHGTAKEVVNL